MSTETSRQKPHGVLKKCVTPENAELQGYLFEGTLVHQNATAF
jgi:hypothetical protein